METPLEKYLQLIDYWKINQPFFKKGQKHIGYEAHHPIPKSFKKIKHKNEITFQLEKLYFLDETILVPYHIHFELHKLLIDIFPERSQEWFKMNNAMFWIIGKNQQYDITPDDYSKMKFRINEAFSIFKNTPEQKEKSRLASLGKKHTDEARKNMSIVQLLVQNRPELKEKKSKNRTELWKNDEYRQSVMIAMKAASNTDEVRKKRSDAQKIAQNLPEVRMKNAETNAKIEIHEKRSAAISKSFEKQDKEMIIERLRIANKTRFKDPKEREKSSKNPKLFFALRRLAKRLASLLDIEDVKITSSTSANISKLYVRKKIHKTRDISSNAHAVNCYEKDTFSFITMYSTFNDAVKNSGACYSTVSRLCRHVNVKSCKFIFRYADDSDQPLEHVVPRKQLKKDLNS